MSAQSVSLEAAAAVAYAEKSEHATPSARAVHSHEAPVRIYAAAQAQEQEQGRVQAQVQAGEPAPAREQARVPVSAPGAATRDSGIQGRFRTQAQLPSAQEEVGGAVGCDSSPAPEQRASPGV